MKTIIIAEAGVNHNGDMAKAMKLVSCAADAGADFVKFQTFKANKIAVRSAPKAAYQVGSTGQKENQFEMLKKLELSKEDHLILIAECKRLGIGFMSTAFDAESFEMLTEFGVPLIKIPSGDITNLPFLRQVGSQNLPILISTGMANLGDIEAAIAALEDAGSLREQITVLHCSTEYPTPMNEVNLRAMISLQAAFGVSVGYSDHTLGIEVATAAVALGASVIEKHFTLDRTLPGPDHQASLEPDELKAMVTAIRNIEAAMGSSIKRPGASEQRNRPIARRSMVASKPIAAGEIFSPENVTSKRPGTGLSPMQWDQVMGKKARKDFEPEQQIEL